MKKILKALLPLFVMLAAVSCRIDDSEMSRRSAQKLHSYTYSAMSSMTLVLYDAFSLMSGIDAFIRLSEEEKMAEEYREMRENLKNLDAVNYVYLGYGQIGTGGASLFEVGSQWDFTYEATYSIMYGAGYWGAYPGHGDRLIFTCTGVNEWDVSEDGNEEMLRVSIKGVPSAALDGELDYVMSCKGYIAEDENGYSAEFLSDRIDIFNLVEYVDDEPVRCSIAEGEFMLKTFRYGEELDWCRMTLMPDGTVSYETNL